MSKGQAEYTDHFNKGVNVKLYSYLPIVLILMYCLKEYLTLVRCPFSNKIELNVYLYDDSFPRWDWKQFQLENINSIFHTFLFFGFRSLSPLLSIIPDFHCYKITIRYISLFIIFNQQTTRIHLERPSITLDSKSRRVNLYKVSSRTWIET